MMSVYQSNPEQMPDSEFESGELCHLVVGNRGRLLDPRRTPITIVDLSIDSGMFTCRIDDFEDKGARWEIPFERIDRYQFANGSHRADATIVKRFVDAIERLDKPLTVTCNTSGTPETMRRIEEAQESARRWLSRESEFLHSGDTLPNPETRRGDSRLIRDLQAFMTVRELLEMESAFARQYACNPYSGELIKGHRIVIAELGLVACHDKAVRNPRLFDGQWSRERRAAHVLARLGFVRAMFELLNRSRVILFRGMNTEDTIRAPSNETFISSSFCQAVAESHFNVGAPDATRVLYRQSVPVERVFMTYYETAELNEPFQEAEAVLLFEEGNALF